MDFQVRTVFLIGRTKDEELNDLILDESRNHNDVIQEDFFDSYYNLTLKATMMLKWVNNNCAGEGSHYIISKLKQIIISKIKI